MAKMQLQKKQTTRLRAILNKQTVGEIGKIRKSIMSECIVNKYVLSRWESGKTQIPPLAKIKIAEILKVKISEL